jgi:hypothetical protein
MEFCIGEVGFVICYDTGRRTCLDFYLWIAYRETGHEETASASDDSRPYRGIACHGLWATSSSEAHHNGHLVRVQQHLCCSQETSIVGERHC